MKKVLVACCNSSFFFHFWTLVSTIHECSVNSIDKIYLYDLGLDKHQRDGVAKWHKCQIVDFSAEVRAIRTDFLSPKNFAWKTAVLKDAGQFGDLVLYLDTGVAVLKDLQVVYDIINNDDIFVVGDGNFVNEEWNGWRVKDLTTEQCFRIMKATEEERNAPMICAGIQGYKTGGKYQKYIDDAFEYAKIRECINGNKKNHRHDQSIFSVLCKRHNVPKYHPLSIYGEFAGIVRKEQVFYVHRGTYKRKRIIKNVRPSGATSSDDVQWRLDGSNGVEIRPKGRNTRQ